MQSHTLDILEFEQVLAQVARYAVSELGGRAVEALEPRESVWAEDALATVSEARSFVHAGLRVRLSRFEDVTPDAQRLHVQGLILEPLVLRNFAHVLRLAREVEHDLSSATLPLARLQRIAEGLYANQRLEKQIYSSVDEHGNVRDAASAKLSAIRQHLRDDKLRANDTLREFIEQHRDVVQEPIITIRNDRYVVPLKPTFRRSVNGFIHDQSASKSTLYVEPEMLLPINNELRQLALDEEQEVRRILRSLTADVAALREHIIRSVECLACLDSFFARAAWADAVRAVEPLFRSDRRCKLRQARHPLLLGDAQRQVVPLDIELGDPNGVLIITGPNTGGKTVALKTVGLLHAMALAGIPIAAAADSSVIAIDDLYLDIGDEQSIEQNLSTFSAHCRQIEFILSHATPDSLVLLDEIGAGTEPNEGAALAIAVLDELRSRGAPVVASTHHNPVKMYAHVQDGVQNASMEFDPETLQPTYRLMQGLAGQSNAISVADRLGFPSPVLERARRELAGLKSPFEEMVDAVHGEQTALAAERQRLANEQHHLDAVRRDYDDRLEALNEQNRSFDDSFRRDANEFMRNARRDLEQLVHTLRQQATEGRTLRFPEEEFSKLRNLVEQRFAPPEEPQSPQPPAPGELVELRMGGVQGIVERLVDDGREVIINSAGRRIRAPLREVRRRSGAHTDAAQPLPPEPAPPAASSSGPMHRQAPGLDVQISADVDSVGSEVKLLGQTVEEAMANLDRFLDRAIMLGLASVRVIHGKGTGALQRATAEFLRSHSQVRAFHAEIDSRGGSGVTVAELR